MIFTTALRSSTRLLQRPTSALRSGAPSSILATRFGVQNRFLSQEARDQISKAIKASPVVLFMKGTPDEPQCGFSRAVIQILQMQGVPHEKLAAYNVLEDPELRNGIKEFSEWPTIPQVYVNGEFVGGCDIVLGMHQSGELEELLEKNEVIPKTPSEASEPAPASST